MRQAVSVVGGIVSLLGAYQSFEVASVKPVKELRSFACTFAPGGRFHGFGTPQWLIACAYRIPQARAQHELLGGPTWINEDLFEILATSPPDQVRASPAERLAMIQGLLADRFKLLVYRETREVATYALVVANKNGRLGPRLHPTDAACTAWIGAGRRGAPPPPASDLPCGRQLLRGSMIQGSVMTLAQLGNLLSSRVGRPVEDHTGLSGTFYVNLQWASDPSAQPPLTLDNPPVPEDLPASVFTALREQLGLKLESTKSVLDVLVIDHIERPTPN